MENLRMTVLEALEKEGLRISLGGSSGLLVGPAKTALDASAAAGTVVAAPGGRRGEIVRMGRRSKLTPERVETLTGHLRRGCYFKTACALAGISERTGWRWMARGAKDLHEGREGSEFCQFCQSVKRAEAEAEVRMVKIIRDAALRDWRAAAVFLERRFPNRWGRRRAVAIARDRGGPVVVEVPVKGGP